MVPDNVSMWTDKDALAWAQGVIATRFCSSALQGHLKEGFAKNWVDGPILLELTVPCLSLIQLTLEYCILPKSELSASSTPKRRCIHA